MQILEHTTDTNGYTEIVFGLFDLLGMKFSPRIRDISDQRLYKTDNSTNYSAIDSVIKGVINKTCILQNSENLLRIAGSLKSGWVTASLLVSKYQSYPSENMVVKALKEWGRMNKSISILEYILSESQQRLVTSQLNKGEALHDLRKFLRFADEGGIRQKELEDQSNQAGCLTLVTNAIIVWNTVYMWEVIKMLLDRGEYISDEDKKHISPCRFDHINRYGNYNFHKHEEKLGYKLRPLNIN